MSEGGGKKKLSKAERLRLQKEEEERRLIEEEEARLRAEQEEAERLEKERILREETERLEAKDQERRGTELAELHLLEENFLSAMQWKADYRAHAKWEHYMQCDGSPDPAVPQEINTFMTLWRENKNEDIEFVIEKGNQVLNKANTYADSDSGNMEVVIKDKNITFCIWGNLKKNPRFGHHMFSDAENGFDLPKAVATSDVAVRILHTHYDHISPLPHVPTLHLKVDAPESKQKITLFCDMKEEEEKEVEQESEDQLVTEGRKSTISFKDNTKNDTDENEKLEEESDKKLESVSTISGGKQWRTDGINDIKYKMKEKQISFDMDAFYTITLIQDAHLNMPYQSWELRPTGTDELLFTVVTAFAEVQMQIKGNQCMLSSVIVDGGEQLSHLTGRWTSPVSLTVALKKAGVNIFPSDYSHKFVCVNKKTPLAEITAYQQMALVASAFAFSWSKWNLVSGQDQVVFKVSEHLKTDTVTEEDWSLYMFNGQRAQRLKINESSEAFSEELASNTEFHSTLYHLIKDFASEEALEKVKKTSCLFIDAVYQLLIATRVLTYS